MFLLFCERSNYLGKVTVVGYSTGLRTSMPSFCNVLLSIILGLFFNDFQLWFSLEKHPLDTTLIYSDFVVSFHDFQPYDDSADWSLGKIMQFRFPSLNLERIVANTVEILKKVASAGRVGAKCVQPGWLQDSDAPPASGRTLVAYLHLVTHRSND